MYLIDGRLGLASHGVGYLLVGPHWHPRMWPGARPGRHAEAAARARAEAGISPGNAQAVTLKPKVIMMGGVKRS